MPGIKMELNSWKDDGCVVIACIWKCVAEWTCVGHCSLDYSRLQRPACMRGLELQLLAINSWLGHQGYVIKKRCVVHTPHPGGGGGGVGGGGWHVCALMCSFLGPREAFGSLSGHWSSYPCRRNLLRSRVPWRLGHYFRLSGKKLRLTWAPTTASTCTPLLRNTMTSCMTAYYHSRLQPRWKSACHAQEATVEDERPRR